MVHTHNLQGRLNGCGCQQVATGGKPFRGSQLHRRRSTSSAKVKVQTQCSSTVTNVKLPATHKEASQRALDQLRASSSIVNSKSAPLQLNMVACVWPMPTSFLLYRSVAQFVTRYVVVCCLWLSIYLLHFCTEMSPDCCISFQGTLWRRRAAS